MDFTHPEEVNMAARTLRDYVNRRCIPLEQELEFDAIELPPAMHATLEREIKEMGFWGASLPVEYGGSGLGLSEHVALTEERARSVIGRYPISPFGPEPPKILFLGTELQRRNYLLPLLRGEKRHAFAQTEPDAGSDAAAIVTRAHAEGDDWIINGRKRFVTMADKADFLIVVARVAGTTRQEGITVFLVDRDTPGVHIERAIPVIRPLWTNEVVLDDCRVPAGAVLGQVGEGYVLAQGFVSQYRVQLAAECLGMARRALEMMLTFAGERMTFGAPLRDRQAVQWMVADSYCELEAARLLVQKTAWSIDRGQDHTRNASICKLTATEMAFRVVDRAIQIHGGIGVTKDLPLERWFREIRVMRIVEGPSEIHRWLIARSLFREGMDW